jgi:hypothetical protein
LGIYQAMTDDERFFGSGVWVYCKSHVNPHTTGWCTVRLNEKTKLNAITYEEAVDECRQKGYPLFVFNK